MTIHEVPADVSFAALDDAAMRVKQIASVNVKLSSSLRRLRDECRKEIRSAIGADRLENYDQLHETIKRRFVGIVNATRPTTESLNTASRARREILTEVKQTVSQLGIDTTRIGEIQEGYIAEAQSAVEETLRAREAAPYVEVSSDEAPSLSSNPWEWRSAPYIGQWGYEWDDGSVGGPGTDGFNLIWQPPAPPWYPFERLHSHSEDRLTGGLSCMSRMSLYGSDGEFGYTDVYSELQFWFKMPAAGLVEVWLYLQAIDTPWGGWLADEWGFSDANIEQISRPYLWIIAPLDKPRYGTLLDYRRGEDEGQWGTVIAGGGQYRYAHLFSLDAYSAGQWVLCGVGLHDFNYFWVDDMSLEMSATNRWFLKNVAVRSTGAP